MFNPDLRGDPEERWRRIEQHLLLLDVDVKRLWGRVPQTIDQNGIPGMSVEAIQGGGTSGGTSSEASGGTSGGGDGFPDYIRVTVNAVDNGECSTPITGTYCLPRQGSFQIWQLSSEFQSVTVTFNGSAWQVGIVVGACGGSGYQTGLATDINDGIGIDNEQGEGTFFIEAGCPSGEASSGGSGGTSSDPTSSSEPTSSEVSSSSSGSSSSSSEVCETCPTGDLVASGGGVEFTLNYVPGDPSSLYGGSPGSSPVACGEGTIFINTFSLLCTDGVYGCVVVPDGAPECADNNADIEIVSCDPLHLIITANLPCCGTIVFDVVEAP